MSGYTYAGAERDTACGEAKGTIRGVSRHQRAGTKPCPECRAAKRGYETRPRKPGPKPAAQNTAERRAYRRAYGRALLDVARAHKDEFQAAMRGRLAQVHAEDAAPATTRPAAEAVGESESSDE